MSTSAGLRIVAAAIFYRGMTFSLARPARHHDVMHAMVADFDLDPGRSAEQGFLTSDGAFVRRKPAAVIAERAGQLGVIRPKTNPVDQLFSEDLW